MKYTITIDQEFAEIHNLTLTQVATIAAAMSLATWTETVALNGKIWYRYTEIKMANDFPLLFSIPKRCYKNLTELVKLGFIELTKIGKDKYLTYTSKCTDWNSPKEIVQNRTNSPEMDEKKSENGLKKSPKTDLNNNIIYNNSIIDNNNADNAGLQQRRTRIRKGTSENLCLFVDSKYYKYEEFEKNFLGDEYEEIDVRYYYDAIADWSSQKAKKKNDWIATARNFMRKDNEVGKLHKVKEPCQMDAWARMMQMNLEFDK